MSTRVFLLAGQSNMVGSGRTDELPRRWRQSHPDLRLFQDGHFHDLADSDRFGPEIGFAAGLDMDAGPVVLCKVARGGANLYYDWNPDATAGGPEDSFRGPLYPLLTAAFAAVTQALDAEGEAWHVAGMLWMQGERDCVIEPFAKAYADNLRAFIERVRRDTDTPAMPFIIGQVCPRRLGFGPDGQLHRQHANRETIRAAQASVARELPGVALVASDDLPLGDHLHFTSAALVELGLRFAQALQTLS